MTPDACRLAAPVSYDRVPYPSLSYSQSHPDRLATLATLYGMKPAPVERCRVLELGCAVGGNLIPMAYGLPESTFVGIDASERQIAEGQAAIDSLGLGNITLRCLDFMDVDDRLGQFDYIIAHGIYSWVPPAVQGKVLEICREHLARNGVAYVSYNTYPGWHMLAMVRDMMLYHSRAGKAAAEPEMRAQRSRAFLEFLAEARPDPVDAYGAFLQMYAAMLNEKEAEGQQRCDALLLHDELEENNEPLHFYEFVERAAAQGLQFLAEAEFRTSLGGELAPQVRAALEEMAEDVVELEQYLDFVRNRTFRQTLLSHAGAAPGQRIEADAVTTLYAASRARPVSGKPDIHSVSVEQFRGHDGAVLSTDHPVTKAAMLCLAEVWPAAVPFCQLLSMAGERLDVPLDQDVDALVLGTNLLRAYGYSDSLAELHSFAPAMALELTEYPIASAVVRHQAEEGGKVTNLRHERVNVNGFERFVLQRLDGRHDREALLDALMAGPVAEGVLTWKDEEAIGDRRTERIPPAQGGSPWGGENETVRLKLAAELDRKLALLAQAALLVG